MKNSLPPLRAMAVDTANPIRAVCDESSVKLIQAAAADGTPAIAKYEIDPLYTGGEMVVGFYGRVVIDLEGLHIPDHDLPALRDHDDRLEVGHGRSRIEDGAVRARGVFSGTGDHVDRLIANMGRGMPYQASIGVLPTRIEEVPDGQKVSVNGREFTGPLLVCREGIHHEQTFCVFGADPNTVSRLAAKAGTKEVAMDKEFKAWLQAKGFEAPEELSDEVKKNLKAMWEEEKLQAKKPSTGAPPATPSAPASTEDPARLIQAERERVSAIESACKGDWGEAREQVETIRAEAVRDGRPVEEVNGKLVEILRASRTQSVQGIVVGESNLNAQALTACLCMDGGVSRDNAVKEFGEKPVQAARDLRGVGLVEFIRLAARMAGANLPPVVRDGTEFLRATVSVVELTNIFDDATNRILLDEYYQQETYWDAVAERASVNNFQDHKRYKLTGTGDFDQVYASGKLPHGDLKDRVFTISADTYGSILGISRQDIVNDDLGAFLSAPRMMAREAAYKIDDVTYTLVLANTSSFFGSGNGNQESGVGTALDSDALATAVANFRKQKRPKTDKNAKQKVIGMAANILVVPPELSHTADILNTASSVSSNNMDANPHRGRFTVRDVPYLSDDAFTGYSTTAYYLLNNRVKPFVVSFLKGKDTPTIETGWNPDPEYLGYYVRGYIDFGANQGDPYVARKIAGA